MRQPRRNDRWHRARLRSRTRSRCRGAFTADFTVVRALLQKGRGYEQSVSMFEPYEKVLEPDHGMRKALKQIAARAE